MSNDAKQCPWCQRWCLKDAACNYIFACGLQTGGEFIIGSGCGRSWCWSCNKKFCGLYIDPVTGHRHISGRDGHDALCCRTDPGFQQADYCPGGHNSHCDHRFSENTQPK